MTQVKTTIDHAIIKQWVEERGGIPAHIKRTSENDVNAGILRIAFQENDTTGSLEEISWDEFFEKFEDKKLAFLFTDEMAGKKKSRFLKFVKRE